MGGLGAGLYRGRLCGRRRKLSAEQIQHAASYWDTVWPFVHSSFTRQACTVSPGGLGVLRRSSLDAVIDCIIASNQHCVKLMHVYALMRSNAINVISLQMILWYLLSVYMYLCGIRRILSVLITLCWLSEVTEVMSSAAYSRYSDRWGLSMRGCMRYLSIDSVLPAGHDHQLSQWRNGALCR